MTSDEAFCKEDGTERVGIDPISQCGIVFLLVYLPSIMFDFCMVITCLNLYSQSAVGGTWLLSRVKVFAFCDVFGVGDSTTGSTPELSATMTAVVLSLLTRAPTASDTRWRATSHGSYSMMSFC